MFQVVGRELLLHLIDHLVTEYENNTESIVELLTSTRVHILVSMNPDGFELAYKDEFARLDCGGVIGRYMYCGGWGPPN